MWYNPRTPPALPPRSPKRPDQTGLPSPPLLPPRPVSYMPYRPAGPEQWDTSPLQWAYGNQRRQSVPAGAPVSSNNSMDTSQTLRRKPVGAEVRAKTEADVVHEPWTDDVPQLRAAVSFTVAARSAREASLCVLCESRVHIRKPSQLRTAFAAK
ncbi:hypothetical protein VdG1_07438 [Verticillium dahliae VDG1]|nr:hypothetical protein VdG1_07438 [Verticillium dahliae VDG1]